jgi:hypothetical protein
MAMDGGAGGGGPSLCAFVPALSPKMRSRRRSAGPEVLKGHRSAFGRASKARYIIALVKCLNPWPIS